VWRRRREAASARLSAAPYSAHHKLYSEAVVSSIASAVALAEAGQFKKAVQYLQKAAKALYEAAKEVFERVKVAVQRLVELFVEAVTRMLAWIDEHKAYLFLRAAVAAGVIALSVALNMWGLIELEKLAYAASAAPFFAGLADAGEGMAGVDSREGVFNILKNDSDPYKKFKEIAKAANAGRVKLTEPWESLRLLIMPKPSEEKRLMMGKAYSELDEGRKKALFYAVFALEEAFGVYRTALREYVEERGKTLQRGEVGEGPFKRVVYVADLGQIKQLAEKEETAFEKALRVLRERLNECAVKYGLGDLLNVEEGVARELAETGAPELSEFGGVNFGVKALAALIAYREYALGRRGVFGVSAGYWLEVGGSARFLYYPPITAYLKAEKAKTERPAAVEEMAAEALRRLFLKPGADRYRGFVEELTRSGKLALMLEKETKSSYVFRLFRPEEGGGLKELEGVRLRIEKVGEGTVYALYLGAERWRDFFGQELETAMKAAVEVGGRLPVEDRLPYMLSWIASDVAISRMGNKKALQMSTSHLWQLAETRALFGWSIVGLRMTLTLEGPKLAVMVEAPLDELDEAVRKSAEGGWLKTLGIKAESWDGLKRWVADHWGEVIDAVKKQLQDVKAGHSFDVDNALRELEALKNKLNDDKIAREIMAPVLLLMQAERLGISETTLRYFGAVISGAIGGDGYVSAALKEVGLTSGEREIAMLWGAAFAAYDIKTKVTKAGSAFHVVASGEDAVKLASLYFRYGSPLLEGDERIINHKLYEAMKLAAEGLDVSWEGLRRTDKGLVAADLTISGGNAAVKYNVYLLKDAIKLQFVSTDRSRVELAARLLRLVGVGAEMKKVGKRGEWHVWATTEGLAVGHKELRDALAEIVRAAVKNGLVDAGKAERWLEKLERGRVLMEGWPKYHVGLVRSGALEVKYQSTNPDGIEREAQRLRDMGLVEGVHFSVKMPEGGKGYVSILKEGLAYAAWLSVHGEGERQKLAAEFVEYILQRAREEGGDVYRKALEVVEEGRSWGSLTLRGFEGRVEVGGREHVVKVIGGGAEFDEGRGGKTLLRIRITAEVGRVEGEHTIVDRVVREYTITFSRRGRNNAAVGFAIARADAPDGREADAERFTALIKALTGRRPRVYRMKNGAIIIMCGREHLDGLMRYAELADAIKKWLEETGQ
jgi:tetratricopeptide (TPR) repeat protein